VGHSVSLDRRLLLNEYLRIRHPHSFASLTTFCTMKGTAHDARGGVWPAPSAPLNCAARLYPLKYLSPRKSARETR